MGHRAQEQHAHAAAVARAAAAERELDACERRSESLTAQLARADVRLRAERERADEAEARADLRAQQVGLRRTHRSTVPSAVYCAPKGLNPLVPPLPPLRKSSASRYTARFRPRIVAVCPQQVVELEARLVERGRAHNDALGLRARAHDELSAQLAEASRARAACDERAEMLARQLVRAHEAERAQVRRKPSAEQARSALRAFSSQAVVLLPPSPVC